MIAHDLLEHSGGLAALGNSDEELEALGGLWQVRGRHGDLLHRGGYSNNSVAHAVAMDIVGVATDLEYEGTGTWRPGYRRLSTKPHVHDEDFMEILDIARKAIPIELFDDEERERFAIERFLDDALHLMRIGFEKARRRFGDGYKGYETFRAVRDAVEPHAKRVDFAGQEFILCYGNERATCREITHEESW